ncbi:uncharacterized protein LOC103508656 isoform X2 [Diaphorina citri]|uniref:Uncharacterized protein LOC103508656 isoform X2 n=2 Tax=Diaphorina citri TaxID=121845 RepID=A0A3Q0IRV5_DIACI|nr:uncharacterized protein LOC103508656 isoform X2 [Diaphorina citri]
MVDLKHRSGKFDVILTMRLKIITLLIATFLSSSLGQSNYADQANSIQYVPGEGLPESTILDGKVTKLDDLSPVIFLNRTKAALNCAAGYMQIEMKFEEPFYGIVYADFDRSSACMVTGKGNRSARIDLPLKGCGTRQDPQRVFTNNIVVRFHPALEMDGDEVITIVCRYPPPIAPAPPQLPAYILNTPPPTPLEPPLKGFQILLIICGILFLSLVLLGLGVSYYCLRNQRLRVVRRHPLISGSGSEITKISDSSIGNISMFEGLKIPRAHALATSEGSYSSEAALISGQDTLPSDYPSESPSSTHSEVEDVETRSLRRSVSSGGSYDNKGYYQETEESYYATQQEIINAAKRKPLPPEPNFDVQVRVKRAPPPPPSPTPPPSESEVSLKLDQSLSTIHETEEMTRITRPPTTFTYVPEIHPPPVYSKIIRKPPVVKTEETMYTSEELINIDQTKETIETRRKKSPPPPPPPMKSSTYSSEMEVSTTELIEPPVVVHRRPEITKHEVDDVFLRTVTEKRTIEDIERHRRQVTEYHAKPPPLPNKWDVTIRNYPNPDPTTSGDETATDWESYSEASSISGLPTTPLAERHLTNKDYRSIEINQREYMSSMEVVPPPPPKTPVQNWDVLIRVLQPPPVEETVEEREYLLEKTLTKEDRKKWREIITTESTLKTLLTEASTREDYEKIRRDPKYDTLFEPHKWDVIIRILSPPERQFDQRGGPAGSNRYRRKADWDTRSRRSSLPTLYEYDSDGGSSVRTLSNHQGGGVDPIGRSRRTSRSSLRSDIDVRSMSEVMVDFARAHVDNLSESSSYYNRNRRYYDDESRHSDEEGGSLVRSLSQPSLARSGSEFTEHWGIRGRNWDLSSPEHSPRSTRRSNTSSHVESRSRIVQSQHGWFSESGN